MVSNTCIRDVRSTSSGRCRWMWRESYKIVLCPIALMVIIHDKQTDRHCRRTGRQEAKNECTRVRLYLLLVLCLSLPPLFPALPPSFSVSIRLGRQEDECRGSSRFLPSLRVFYLSPACFVFSSSDNPFEVAKKMIAEYNLARGRFRLDDTQLVNQ